MARHEIRVVMQESNYKEFSPPWIRFPELPRLSMGWQMEHTHQYLMEFESFFKGLDESYKIDFMKTWPESIWWPDYYQFLIDMNNEVKVDIQKLHDEHIRKVDEVALSYLTNVKLLIKQKKINEAEELFSSIRDGRLLSERKEVKCLLEKIKNE